MYKAEFLAGILAYFSLKKSKPQANNKNLQT